MSEIDPQDDTVVPGGPLNSSSGDGTLSIAFEKGIPTAIGPYRVLRVLGTGGFGIVYLAEDAQLTRKVAIKLSRRDLGAREAAAYLEEARMVAGLDHDHIVPVYSVGSTEEHPLYIVSKYIEGATLRDCLAERRFRFDEAVGLVATIADALHYAHTSGLVHRDVKPANILIGSDNKPYIVDFGLALREGDVGQGSTCAGTPSYMSPEQARGEGHRVDGRSDIFSLGIVFYEMLAGQKPFRGSKYSDILEMVEFHDPKPLRQFDDHIPRELERICHRAIEKRASERFRTAKDFGDDLRHFLSQQQTSTASMATQVPPPASDSTAVRPLESETSPGTGTTNPGLGESQNAQSLDQQLHIVPKGLRSFDEHDADFFMNLLPGPRDREGLPDVVRFWKTQIEELDSEKTFSVGLIYGPSGCGKSSLVKAALLPRLGYQVDWIYVESAPQETESRLLRDLRKCFPDIPPEFDLKETLTEIRRGRFLPPSQKLLIILDQFEQWLHSPRDLAESELVHALRQCDGGRVQCIVMVRDDFWMSVARFMKALEVRLLEGQNSAAVDLFDKKHAEKVLRAFGFAFGCLPQRRAELTADQKQFLQMAIDGLAREGRVICVRLAVFAEMMKARDWTQATWRDVGGAEGLGVNFLEETFNSASAPPERRYHQAAARAVLRCLLPDSGSDMKGHMRSEDELIQACGYGHRKADFEELIGILDGSLRLISAGDSAEDSAATTDRPPTKATRYYQLAHDYLVGSIRDWLTRKQQETLRGRAQLLLTQRSELWNARQEAKQLPSLVEWLRIVFWTRRSNRTQAEEKMMHSATRRHGRNLALGGLLVALTAITAVFADKFISQQHDAELARVRVDALLRADVTEVPGIIAELEDHKLREFSTTLLRRHMQEQPEESRESLYASLALLQSDPVQQRHFLLTRMLSPNSLPEELSLVCQAFEKHAIDPSQDLWVAFNSATADRMTRFRALCMLAQTDPQSPRWPEVAPFVAEQLVGQTPLSSALAWSYALRPVQEILTAPLSTVFRGGDLSETEKTVALNVLADYGQTDPKLLTSLILDVEPQQFGVLIPAIQQNRADCIALLRGRLAETPAAAWKNESSACQPASADLIEAIESAQGMLNEHFAFCHRMPLEQFREIVEKLGHSGYRPVCFRPFEYLNEICVAAVWNRDELDWHINYGTSAEELQSENSTLHSKQMLPVDIAHYRTISPDIGVENRFAAVWASKWDEVNDAGMYVGVPEEEHQSAWSDFVSNHFSIRTNLKIRDLDGTDLYSSVRWRLWHEPRCQDEWNDGVSEYLTMASRGWTQRDVRLSLDYEHDHSPAFAAVWWDGSSFETRELHGLNVEQHLARGRDLMAKGFRPWSISVVSPPSGTIAASVWARPIDEEHLDRFAMRKANAAVALLQLNATDEVWPLLRHTKDPRLRAILIDRFGQLDCPVQVLIDRLQLESDVSVRRALFLSLTSFDFDDMEAEQRDSVVAMLAETFQTDPDPGIHSACDLLLRQWGLDQRLQKATDNLPVGPSPERRWFVNGQGQTLAIVPGPIVFKMGSVPHTADRNNNREMCHHRRIERSFAIATREVTVEEFQRLRPDFDFAKNLSRSSDCPINGTSWFDAAIYCRLLSEAENVPEDQMCFPTVEEIKRAAEMSVDDQPVMKLPENYLTRTGYRLPTEAEWEYACRSGATTERYFGQTELLLSKHAWTIDNARVDSQYRSWPVARLRPNDLGLFDMLGNVMEWCQTKDADYPDVSPKTIINDVEDSYQIYRHERRPVRGGAYLYQPSNARAGHRDNAHGVNSAGYPYIGFRVARTMSVEP